MNTLPPELIISPADEAAAAEWLTTTVHQFAGAPYGELRQCLAARFAQHRDGRDPSADLVAENTRLRRLLGEVHSAMIAASWVEDKGGLMQRVHGASEVHTESHPTPASSPSHV